MQKVLVVDATRIVRGGGETHLLQLDKFLKEDGRFKSYILLNKAMEGKIESSHVYVGSFSILFKYKLYFRLAIKYGYKNVIYFIPGGGYMPFVARSVTMFRNMLPFDKIQVQRYFFSFKWLRLQLLRCYFSFSYRVSHGVIFLTEYGASLFPKARNKAVIPHGINIEERHSNVERKCSSNHFTFLNLGSISIYRNQIELIEAFVQCFRGHESVKLIIAGPIKDGLTPELEKLLKVEGVKELVEIVGRTLSDQEVTSLYNLADAFIYNSSCETFGMTILEAMSHGLPILSSNFPGNEDILGKSGLRHNLGDLNQLMTNMKLIVRDDSLCKEMSSISRSRSQEFSWPNSIMKTLDFLYSS